MKSHPVIAGIYRVAIICGALPLIVGTSVFLLWFATGWEWLPIAGILTIYAGVFLFAVGVCVLGYQLWAARTAIDLRRGRLWIAVSVCAILMLGNFPAALGLMALALEVVSAEYVVQIDNRTKLPLGEIRVFGGGLDEDYKDIAPDAELLKRFWIKQDGDLKFEAVSNGHKIQAVIENGVTRYKPGHKTITVMADGQIEVSDIPYRD
jgi:hypothetical protein